MYRRLVKETVANTEGMAASMRGYSRERWDGREEVGALGLNNCKEEAFHKMERRIESTWRDKRIG